MCNPLINVWILAFILPCHVLHNIVIAEVIGAGRSQEGDYTPCNVIKITFANVSVNNYAMVTTNIQIYIVF